MRPSLTVVALVIALACCVDASARAVTTSGPNAPVCKVLRKAIAGTVVGHYAKHLGGSGPTGCKYDGGAGGTPWDVELSLDSGVTVAGGPKGYARLFCKPIVANKDLNASWLTKAQTGANVACANVLKDEVKSTTHAFFAKGRWYGELILFTPPSGGGLTYISLLLKQVTAQLT